VPGGGIPAESAGQEEPDGTELSRAERLLQQGDYPAAIELFQRALASDPASARARDGLKRATDAKATEDLVFGRGGTKKSVRRK